MDKQAQCCFIGGTMKIGDLVYYRTLPKEWGFIVKEDYGLYLVYWNDGVKSWVGDHNVVLLEAR